MNELRTLLVLELRCLYGINQYRHTKDPKVKNRSRLLGAVWVLVICMMLGYVGGMVYGMCALGLGEIVPMYLTVLSSLLILIFGLFTAGNRIFGQKGYDLLASLPLHSGTLVLSRFLTLYVEDLLLTLAVFLPGAAVYGVCFQPDVCFYLAAMAGALFVPAIPLVISVLLGTLVRAISSRMKNKSLVQTVLMVVPTIGILVGSFRLSGAEDRFTPEAVSQFLQTAGTAMERLYPPAMWLGGAMAGGRGLGLFVLVSLGIMAVAVWLVSGNFHGIQRRLGNFTAKHDYQIGAMERRSILKALYLREARRYFASSIYVTNTIIGPILGAVMAIALCVSGLEALESALPIALDIPGMLPFVFGAVSSMMTTTSVSISMEGRQFWVVKSLPIPTKALLDSKILLNLSLMLPCYLVSETAMIFAVKPGIMELMWLVLIPASILVFSVVFGIAVNLKFYSFDWEKEETVVKQSLPAMLGGFAGFLASGLLGAAALAVPEAYGNAARLGICLLLWIGTAVLYRKNNQAHLETL